MDFVGGLDLRGHGYAHEDEDVQCAAEILRSCCIKPYISEFKDLINL